MIDPSAAERRRASTHRMALIFFAIVGAGCSDESRPGAAEIADCRAEGLACVEGQRCTANDAGEFACREEGLGGQGPGGEGEGELAGEGEAPGGQGEAPGGQGGDEGGEGEAGEGEGGEGEAGEGEGGEGEAGEGEAGEGEGGEGEAGEGEAGEGEAGEGEAGEGEAGEGEAGEGEAGEGEAEDCGNFRRLLKPHPSSVARVMLVVDRSFSMIEDDDRWTPITQALGTVTARLGEAVQFGLLLFPHPTQRNRPPGVPEPCIPGVVNVEPGPNRSLDIVTGLRDGQPRQNMGTPTSSALGTAAEWLRRDPTENDYILLATDGGPGCNLELDPLECVCNTAGSNCCLFEAAHNCLDDVGTTALIGQLAEDGIQTLVLGITEGQEDDGAVCGPAGACGPNSRCVYGGQECIGGTCSNQLTRVLDDMAVAGRTAVDGHHFEVADLAQLERQLAAAVGSVAACGYDLGPLAAEADRLIVRLDGEVVPRDPGHVNGWDVQGAELEFHGQACQALRDGVPHEITAACE